MTRSKTSFFKACSDDWHGNFLIADDARYVNEKYVHVSLLRNFTSDGGLHRVCVWGNDDCGMEYDTEDLDDAERVFREIAMQDLVYRDLLLN